MLKRIAALLMKTQQSLNQLLKISTVRIAQSDQLLAVFISLTC
jgi:hypothetical protein